MIRSETRLHEHPPKASAAPRYVKLPNTDQLHSFLGQCENCNFYIYAHRCEASGMWYLSGEYSKKYGGINRICSFCFQQH